MYAGIDLLVERSLLVRDIKLVILASLLLFRL